MITELRQGVKLVAVLGEGSPPNLPLFSSLVCHRLTLCQGRLQALFYLLLTVTLGSVFVPIFQLRKLRFWYVARIPQLDAMALELNPGVSATQTQALNDRHY